MIGRMIRTRDLFLVLTAIAFLCMAIGVTVFSKLQNTDSVGTDLQPAVVHSGEYGAEVATAENFSRAQKLQTMRDKIAASEQLSITAPEPEEILEELPATTTASSSEVAVTTEVQLCPGYAASSVNWSPVGIQIEEVEGARLVYKEQVVTESVGTGTSTETQTATVRDILVQLPVRNFPAAAASCISSDVIGIATDGSLIRNNEAGVYGIFGSNTLVGWALDGFPIYGSSAAAGDACGGVMAAEGYRYQISAQRDTIIHCFSATPIRL